MKKITFESIKHITHRIGEDNDCTVKAVAISCQIPYEEAHEYLASIGRQKGRGWYWSSHRRAGRQIHGYVDSLTERTGFKTESVSFKPCTVSTIGKQLGKGHYMVSVRGHVLAVVDGKVEDWTEGRRHKVQKVVRILNPRIAQATPVETPTGLRKMRHRKAKRLGLDPKTHQPI